MKVGQPFDASGMFIPNWLLASKKISPVGKLCYTKLCQYDGSKEKFPSRQQIADAIGIPKEHVDKAIRRLERFGLIRTVQPKGQEKLLHAHVHYDFLWHPIICVDSPKGERS